MIPAPAKPELCQLATEPSDGRYRHHCAHCRLTVATGRPTQPCAAGLPPPFAKKKVRYGKLRRPPKESRTQQTLVAQSLTRSASESIVTKRFRTGREPVQCRIFLAAETSSSRYMTKKWSGRTLGYGAM